MHDEQIQSGANTGDTIPANWWQHSDACRNLSHHLGAFVVPLLVVCSHGRKTYEQIYSGFVVFHGNRVLWITAGHVIDDLRHLVRSPEIRVRVAQWADGYTLREASHIPIDLADLVSERHSMSLTGQGFDFGFAAIRPNHVDLLHANPRRRFLTKQIWTPPKGGTTLGYHLVGYPTERVETARFEDGRGISGSVRATMAVLPVQRIAFRGPNEFDDFWSDPDAFYGEVVPYSDGGDTQPTSVDGMSGGPLFCQTQFGDEAMYHLVGVQRSEKRKERLIRVEPWHRLTGLFEAIDRR